jgi:hypothetical protein
MTSGHERFELGSDRPLKVLIAAYRVSPIRGSEARNGWHLTSALAASGVDVHVITGAGWRAEIEAHGRPGDGLTFHCVSRRALPRGIQIRASQCLRRVPRVATRLPQGCSGA